MREFDTVQEACDYAVKQIVAQGVQCLAASGRQCAYGDKYGNHCAIGWLLDHNDEELMSFGGSVVGLVTTRPDKAPKIVRENGFLFARLQAFHDALTIDDRRLALQSLQKCGLDTSAPHWQQWVDMGVPECQAKKEIDE